MHRMFKSDITSLWSCCPTDNIMDMDRSQQTITICSSVSPRRRRCTEDSEDWGCLEPAPGPSQRIGPGHQSPHTSAYNLAKLALYLFKISRNFIFIYDLWQDSFRKYIWERKNINKYYVFAGSSFKTEKRTFIGSQIHSNKPCRYNCIGILRIFLQFSLV